MSRGRHSRVDSQVDYYEILEIAPDATSDVIQRAYRQKAKKFHPDLNPDREEWAKIQFQRLNDAYEILSDKEARQRYDTLRWRFNVYSINPDQITEQPEPEVELDEDLADSLPHWSVKFRSNKILSRVAFALIVVIAILVPVYLGLIKPTQDAVAQNDGFGIQANPIPANRLIELGDFSVRMEPPIYYANHTVQAMNPANRSPEDGYQFVLMKMHVTCHKAECTGGELRIDALDGNNKSWGQPRLMWLRVNLDYLSATDGNMMSGWVLFEMPVGSHIASVRFWYLGGPIIYAYPAS